MSTILRTHYPLIVVLGLYWATLGIVLDLSLKQNQGHLVYALDDTYIHMSMAKNFATSGVWGVTKHGYTSSTSSPLWTFSLSLVYLAAGVNEVAPLALNVILGSLALSLAYAFLRRSGPHPLYVLVVLLLVLFATPLPALTFIGLEHLLHALLTLLFVSVFVDACANRPSARAPTMWLLLLAPLVTAARFEGIFLIAVVTVILALRRRLFTSLLVAGTGALPVLIYAATSVLHGWYPLPNPVLLKGNLSSPTLTGILSTFGYDSLVSIQANPHILSLVIASLIVLLTLYVTRDHAQDEGKLTNIVLIAVIFLHMQFARYGWFYRYEAYLVFLGILVVAATAYGFVHGRLARTRVTLLSSAHVTIAMLLVVVGIFPFLLRGYHALREIPAATTNIYEQQYQMASFLRQFYQHASIAANDIGAINYFADLRALDLWGLGTLEPARLRLRRAYGAQQIHDLARQEDVQIAIVYDAWFTQYGGLPPQWGKVGEWKTANNTVLGSDTVSFYVVDPAGRGRLLQSLRAFSAQLPASVAQHGEYLEKQ